MQRDFENLKLVLLSRINEHLNQWLPGGEIDDGYYETAGLNGGRGTQLRVSLEDGSWYHTEEHGLGGHSLVSLYMAIHAIDDSEAYDELTGKYDWPNEQGKKKSTATPLLAPAPVAALPTIDITSRYPSLNDGFHTLNEDNKWVPQYDECARYMIDQCGLRVKNGYSYLYRDTHYEQVPDDLLKQTIDRLLLRTRSPNTVNNFYKAAIYKASLPDCDFDQPQGFINCLNGTLRIKDRVLLPHTKDQFFTYVLPHNYDAYAKCNEWEFFLHYVLLGRDELKSLAAEIFGYVLEGGKPWLHKAFILYGSGRNGKSTFLDVLRETVGPNNCCSVPIQKLNREFSVVKLDGKLANIVGELSAKDADSDAFKSAIAGDPLMGGEKHKKDYLITPLARHLFAANHFPRFHDTATGVVERLCILPFERYIPADERDGRIAEKLMAEIPGILNWALDGLDRLHARTHLPKVEAVDKTLVEYRLESDSVYAFFTENFRVDKYPEYADDEDDVDDDKIPKTPRVTMRDLDIKQTIKVRDMYGYYDSWCRKNGRIAKSDRAFSRDMADLIRKTYPNLAERHPQNLVAFRGRIWIEGSPKKFSKLAVGSVHQMKPRS